MTILVAFLFALTLCIVSTNAIDTLPQFVRRASTTDVSEGQGKLRSIFAAQAYHFDQALVSQEPHEFQECVSCFENQHNRQLQLFPKLRERVKNAIAPSETEETSIATTTPSTTPTSGDEIVEMIQSSLSASIFGNSTVGGLFDILGSNPILLGGVISVALFLVLGLIILEAISLTTSTPILCILGLSSSILFGSCGRRKLIDVTFLQKFFPDGAARIPDNTTDIAAELTDIIDFGLSVGIREYLNNVTVSSVLTEIARDDATNPLLAAALIAILPLLMLEGISTEGNTPIKCILGNCRRLNTDLEHSSEHLQHQCEMELFTCEMNNALAMLGRKN
jgi:hypothetical protein